MGTMIKRNTTTFSRCPKDFDHPFTRMPAKLFNLDGYQLAIMGFLISNRDDWKIVKSVIANRAKFPRNKFDAAWKSLEDLGYINKRRIQGGWDYTIIEDPSFTNTTYSKSESSTLTTGTQCAGGVLTTIKNNYNIIERIDQPKTESLKTLKTTKTDNVNSEEHNQFLELKDLFPNDVTRPDGKNDYLKTNIKRCEELYADYLKEGLMTHKDVMDCLKTEIDERERNGNLKYIKRLVRWLDTREFEGYIEKVGKTVFEAYGTEVE
jgi:hypothetical protein